MLRQYQSIKAQHPDAILLFRLGDFYEMFYDDAVVASKHLEITLTSRNKNDPNPIPLCGVPYHSIEPYIAKLLEKGEKVAICDQVEDPRQAKGVVKREVTRVVTPGVVADGLGLDATADNFLAGIALDEKGQFGLALADISTGLFQADTFDTPEAFLEELARAEPRELLVNEACAQHPSLMARIQRLLPNVLISTDDGEPAVDALEALTGGAALIERMPVAAQAAARTLSYLQQTQRGNLRHITAISSGRAAYAMRLDEATKRNLELTRTMPAGEREGSLLHALDRTTTALGSRLLKRWILYPLIDVDAIEERLEAVASILSEPGLLRALPETLREIYDLERITTRVALGSANARDLLALRESLAAARLVREQLADSAGLIAQHAGCIDPADDLIEAIAQTIADEPPLTIREGGIIRNGIDEGLDELRHIIDHGKDYIASIEAAERKRTGISSLKIRYNKVFGYYLEVTNAHRDKVPADYIRKQTLANAERYITPQLKEREETILGAQEKARALEYDLFVTLRERIAEATPRLQATAEAIAAIDALTGLARIAAEYDYCRPTVDDGSAIDIQGGRHPIVERMDPSVRFVPNDVLLDDTDNRLLLITGPNMAGKSTVMRQSALIVLMAQIGSFVPATSARIGVADRIFTRVGASDALAQGQSTFMVEMSEAATILREAGPKSLVIIDEIGRGTSTFDGLAIAWAVAEDLHDRVRARTLFATHYHELTELALQKTGLRNMHIAVKEWNGEVVFLRRLVPGATSHSYGIQVAKLAGLPEGVIGRATEVLTNLEAGEFDEVGSPRIGGHRATDHAAPAQPAQFQLFTQSPSHEVVTRLHDIDPNTTTPLEALTILQELKKTVTRNS